MNICWTEFWDKEDDSKEQAVEVEIVTVVEAGSPVAGGARRSGAEMIVRKHNRAD